MQNIYLLTRKEPADLDECVGFVIMALTPERAAMFANNDRADEGPIWSDPTLTTCTHIGTGAGPEGIVLRSFRAG